MLAAAAGKIRLPWVVIILLLISLPFAPSSGKVFLSRLLAQGSSIFDPTGGGQQIYQAAMTVNGARATLSIYGCDEPLEVATARLKQSFKSSEENYFIRNEKSAWMLSIASNQVWRLLALAAAPDRSLIFALVQPPAEFLKSTAVPSESAVFSHSLLPASRLETIIKNEETGATLETRIAEEAPDMVINEISEKLSRNGWKHLYPPVRDDASQPCFLVFQRGKTLCTVIAGNTLCKNQSCVTILTKEINPQ